MRKKFLELIAKKAKQHPASIVFPETDDERIVKACVQIAHKGTARPVLIGKMQKIGKFLQKLGVAYGMSQFKIIDMEGDGALRAKYAKRLFELRKEKGMTIKEAEKLMLDRNYFGVMVVEAGDADGLISGACCPSADTLRPALKIIKTKERFHKVSGFFFMMLGDRLLLFADCMVNIEPNSTELADIAIDTAETAKRFGIRPKIAMLSFSTHGSTDHPNAKRVAEAAQMVRYRRPDLICEGEMQVDAALVSEIAAKKFPESQIKGDANILIFPNLEAANISYKLVERLAHAKAIGPILQGLRKPINDLSRGCSADDIVQLAAITSVEAQKKPFDFCFLE